MCLEFSFTVEGSHKRERGEGRRGERDRRIWPEYEREMGVGRGGGGGFGQSTREREGGFG